MECKKFELTASAYIDRQLDEREASRYREHLVECEACRSQLAETEALSMTLRNSDPIEVPRELRGYVMNEAARRSRKEVSLTQEVFEWMLKLNPVPVSVASGVIVSLLSFATLFSSFKPIPIGAVESQAASIFPVISGS